MPRILVLSACALLAACAGPGDGAAAAPAAEVAAGPMVGPVGDRSATLWVQSDAPARWIVEVRAPGGDWTAARGASGGAATLSPDADGGLCAQATVHGLRPATRYAYRLRARGGKPLPAESEQAFRTAPPPGAAEELVVAFGSCAGDWGPDPRQPIFRAVDARRPDLFVWLGDNVYFDRDAREWEDPDLMEARWRTQRALPHLQPLLRRTAHLAIWDDHDYGPNDSDRRYAHKDAALRLFTRYWPGDFAPERGVARTHRRGRVEFFLLDTRYFRDPDDAPQDADKTILGAEQFAWLCARLQASDADFKVICSGTQVLARYHDFESWDLYRHERDRLLRFLRDAGIGGVLFLSGDRHLGEVLRWTEAPAPYPLWEFTASPLAAGIGGPTPDAEAPERLPGSQVRQEHFGLLRFSWRGDGPSVRYVPVGVSGAALREPVEVPLDALQPAVALPR